jgi:hypothetical protein
VLRISFHINQPTKKTKKTSDTATQFIALRSRQTVERNNKAVISHNK